MSMLDIVGLQLTNLTAYNEYITDVIIAIIVYLSAFSLVIRMLISGHKKRRNAKVQTVAATTEPLPADTLPDTPPDTPPDSAAVEEGGGEA